MEEKIRGELSSDNIVEILKQEYMQTNDIPSFGVGSRQSGISEGIILIRIWI
jgi:hypothetical protein